MIKALIVPGNTDLNRGDQALVWESIQVLRNAYEEIEVKIIQSGSNKEEIDLQTKQSIALGYNFLPQLISHPSKGEKETNGHNYGRLQFVKWAIRSLISSIPRVLLLFNNPLINKIVLNLMSEDFKKTYKYMKECDLIVYKGGGFIHSYGPIKDVYIMFYFLYYGLLGKSLNKSVIMMPNSFGPFNNKIATKFVSYSLNKFDKIYAREKVSVKSLNSINVNSTYFPDLGFFMESDNFFDVENYFSSLNIVTNNTCENVGITVRPYRFDGHPDPLQAYENYLSTFTDVIEHLLNKNYNVYLIAQTLGPSKNENDVLAIEEIYGRIRERSRLYKIIDFKLNAKQIKKIYSKMDYVIGTRFHSVIFSLSSKVPSIAVAYGGNKGIGIMKELNLDAYSIRIEDVNTISMIEKFDLMVNNRQNIQGVLNEKNIELKKLHSDLIKNTSGII